MGGKGAHARAGAVLIFARARSAIFGSGKKAGPVFTIFLLAACTGPLSTLASRHDSDTPRIPTVAAAPAPQRLVAVGPAAAGPAIKAVGTESEADLEIPTTSRPEPAPRRRRAERAPKPQPEPQAPDALDPDRLFGLSSNQVVALLGAPSLLRRDPPAELWLYEGNACTAHLFLYQSGPGDDYRVRHLETGGNGSVAGEVCLGSFVGGNGRVFGRLR